MNTSQITRRSETLVLLFRVCFCVAFTAILLLPMAFVSAGEAFDPALGPPPGSYRILSEDGEVSLPFELFRGDIRFLGEMNGKEVRMLIDNGFIWDQLLFFGSPRVDSLGMVHDGEVHVGGSGEGDVVPSLSASGITISFPGVEFTDQTAIITPHSTGRMWWGAEGQVSATFFKHFVVAFDFNRKQMTLVRPEEFIYEGDGVEIPMIPLPNGAWAL
ncbi:hypothetical protein ACFL6M_08030, partial [Candidatus Eisenbacteria bacterium]